MRVPAVVLAVPFVVGAAAGVVLVEIAPERFAAAAVGAAVLALLAGAGFYLEDEGSGVATAVVIGALAAGYAGAAASAREVYGPPLLAWFDSSHPEAPVVIEGRLREDAVGESPLLHLDVRRVTGADGVARETRGGIRLFLGGAPASDRVAEWRAGRILVCPATLRRPGSFRNPGVPDDRKALARRGIVLTGTIKSASLVQVAAPGSRLDEAAAEIRRWVRGELQRHVGVRDPRSAAVAIAILIGDRTGLSDEDERRLQDAGTYHVIAISGGNIAILTATLLLAARLVRIPSRAAAGITIGCLLFYGEIAGGTASVERAITAAVVVLSAFVLDHRGAALNVLGVAAVAGVAYAPVAVLDPGFLLSFGATAAIILGARRFAGDGVEPGRPSRRARVAQTFRGMLTASLCAEIALAPVAASLFFRITVAGVVLNFIAIPLMTVVQVASLALLAASLVAGAWARVFAPVVHHAADALVESSRFVELVPWVARDVAAPAVWLCAVYYACALTALRPGPWRRWALAGLVLAAATLVLGPGIATRSDAGVRDRDLLRIVVLDVGQGDAVVIMTPSGQHLLVDAGGVAGTSFDIASRVILPSLRALGVRRLHALVLTHGDPDHAGGAEVTMRRLRPGAVWEGVTVPPHVLLRSLMRLTDHERIPWRTVRPGNVERLGAVELRVHHPPEPEWERQRVRNDDSIVLEVRYGRVSVLLPGDIGREVERTLVPRLDLAPLVVLKAPHHGSATSSSDELIDAARPRAVLFSAGQNNRFGHPAPVVVQRYARRGVQLFNTGDDGAVFVETDGKSVEVRGWASGRRVIYGEVGGRTR